MIIHSAEFVVSNTDPAFCPPPRKPEFAFIGRSNVGKSSLINSLAGRKNLALTSSTPGKTRLINHFLINDAWYLVDLPGYGYASVSKSEKKFWSPMIEAYLTERSNLKTTFILLDVRLEPQKIDREFIQWMGESRLPFSLVFTKADKLSKQELQKTHKIWTSALEETWSELPPIFVTSAEKHTGRDELLHYIASLIKTK